MPKGKQAKFQTNLTVFSHPHRKQTQFECFPYIRKVWGEGRGLAMVFTNATADSYSCHHVSRKADDTETYRAAMLW